MSKDLYLLVPWKLTTLGASSGSSIFNSSPSRILRRVLESGKDVGAAVRLLENFFRSSMLVRSKSTFRDMLRKSLCLSCKEPRVEEEVRLSPFLPR